MARHRRHDPADSRLRDDDREPVPGYDRWSDLLPARVFDEPTRELPVVPPMRLVRPYVLRGWW